MKLKSIHQRKCYPSYCRTCPEFGIALFHEYRLGSIILRLRLYLGP